MTWRLRHKPSWLQCMARTSFLVAVTEIHIDMTQQLHHEIVYSLLQYLEAREEQDKARPKSAAAPVSCS